MKKLLVLLLAVLAAGLAGLGYYAYENGLLFEEDVGGASEVSANQPEEASPRKQPEIGVIKPFESQADAMEALDNEVVQNKDTIGWLYIPGTTVNNSVVQSFNNTYYLRKTERKKESIYGCYFADFACSFGKRGELSANTIIYGHSDLKDSPDGPKFSQLFRFTDEEFARAHPDIEFSTVEERMRWRIFAVLYTTSDWNYIDADLSGDALMKLAEEARKESIFTYDVPVSASDKILTLSTCAVKYGGDGSQRFVVMAKLLPEDYAGGGTVDLAPNPRTSRP